MSFCDERLERLAALVDELTSEELDPAFPPPQSGLLVGLLEQADRLRGDVIRRVGVWDRSGEWALDGAVTPASWLRSRARLDEVEARILVRTARLVHDHEPTASALRRGSVPVRRIEQIARTVKDRREAYDENPDLLLGPAATLPDDQFRTVSRRWRELADDALDPDEPDQQHDRRYLHASVTLGGMVSIDALLDPEGGEIFLTALEGAGEPDSPDDLVPPRSAAQRRADALVALATGWAGGSDTGEDDDRPARPQVRLDAVWTVVPEGGEVPDLAALRYELEHVGPVARVTIERLACDCSVGRVLMRGESEVLDLGRHVRLVSKAQRRALVRRDRHCAFPGCTRKPVRCDAHHLVPWFKGGRTDLDNLVLLCRRHHVLCHEGRWELARGADGQVTATPPSRARGPGRPRGPDWTLVA